MKKPILIGITGGIGSGKTTLANLIIEKGYSVYNSDIEARKLQNEDPKIRQQLTQLFGNVIYNSDGLDRVTVSKMVFENKELLSELTKIVHPIVNSHLQLWINNHSKEQLLFIESAILFESGFDMLVKKIIVITASENTRISRVMKRDNISEEQVRQRISNQLSEKVKIEKADYVIHSIDGNSLTDEMNIILKDILNS